MTSITDCFHNYALGVEVSLSSTVKALASFPNIVAVVECITVFVC